MAKREVYFNEYNIPMENTVYFPLVSGLLTAYARTLPAIRDSYEFRPFLFKRDREDSIVGQYRDPAVAAFSVSMWNMNLSLEVARRVKERNPGCLIVFGGPNVPFDAEGFFRKYPFVDVTTRGEGEQTFADILLRFLESRDFEGVPGLSYRDPRTGACVRNARERELPKDLDIYPSPYLEGVFDYLFDEYPEMNFQVIVETNRGCPYMCSYCFWGQGGLSKRFRHFSLDRVRQVAEWCGRHRIVYVFCADSNFGIFKRDLEIAGYFVDTKVRSGGYPEKFRVCYAKNAENTVFEIGRLLHSHDMEKGMTLSRQTNSPAAAANVGRKNIRMEVYGNLQKKYNREQIPVYTELILGLPGESYASFRDGVEEILGTGMKNQLFVYFCQVYPNTELDDAAYRRRFGMETIMVPLNEIHGEVRPASIVDENEEIIVSTASMSREDWRRTAVLSWTMQLLHGLKLGFYLLAYLFDRHGIRYTDLFEYCMGLAGRPEKSGVLKDEIVRFYSITDTVLHAGPRAQILPEFGNIYWDVEEGACLRLLSEKERFYGELSDLTAEFLAERAPGFDPDELREVFEFQKALVPGMRMPDRTEYLYSRNIPEYFDTFFLDERRPLTKKAQAMTIEGVKDFQGDRRAFAMETVVWGRKSNKMLYRFAWRDI